MKTLPTILALALFLVTPITTDAFTKASLQLNVVYRCNGERLIVSRCRDESYSAQQQTQPSGTFEALVESYLSLSGYEYYKVKTNSWYVMRPGQQLKQIRVLVGAGPSTIAVGAVVVPKRNLRITADAMQKMMKLSYDLNYVRVCMAGTNLRKLS